MPTQIEEPGCRDTTIVTVFLLGFGIALFAIGLTLIKGDGCTGLCETAGLTMLYAGGPISALFGVFTDTVVAAWPLDVTLWVVLGFTVTRWAVRRSRSPLPWAVVILVGALAYGLVLSQMVEIAV